MADFQGANGPLRELALFAGAGGGILGGKLHGWQTICAVEYDAYAASVLIARQNDASLDPFPVWNDVRTFDGRPWRGRVDVVSGGFPCQDISAAGKGAGLDGERSGLWSEMSRIIGEVRPSYAFVENSPMLTGRGLGRVLGDLAEMGYDARWGVVSAEDAIWLAGDPCLYHERERIWIVAQCSDALWTERKSRSRRRGIRQGDPTTTDAPSQRRREGRTESAGQQWRPDVAECGDATTDADSEQLEGAEHERRKERELSRTCDGGSARNGDDEKEQPAAKQASWWTTEPNVGRVATGIPSRVDRLRCLGNAQVPLVAALAWQILTSGDGED